MEIVDNKALWLRLKNPHKVTSVIPKSKVMGETDGVHDVLVNWGLDEAQVLKNLGMKVPSPIVGRYVWPGMYTPFSHQRDTAAFLTLHRRAYCFNDPGTGKTMSVAWASDYLMNVGAIRRVLVICPLSIMQAAWTSDLFKTLMHRRADVAHGSREKRVKVIESDAEFVVINFDGVETVLKELKAGGFDLVVIDEASAVKTATTARWKAIDSLIGPDTWLWMLTGTPAAQSPMDAYGLAKMMNPSSVPPYMSHFRDKVMMRITNFKWAPKPNAKDIVQQVLQPAIRFTKDECLDLPELVYTSRDVEMTSQQKKYYETLRKSMVMAASGETVTSVNAAVNLNKLLQISSGAIYTDTGEVLEFDITSRYNELRTLIDESTHKVLVFIPFKHAIATLQAKLVADGYSIGIINGDVPASKRNDIFQNFQNTPNPHVLLIQPAAAAHGVTLHAANTVVWWSPVTSYEIYAQANARTHRQGQKNACLVANLCGSTVEKKLYKALEDRQAAQLDLLEFYKAEVEST